jgi:pyrimidine operon attenuation protein / uracil phosphoribosyltransferase
MILLGKKRIERTLKRMAYQILEEAQSSHIFLIGLNDRGFAVAELIKKNLEEATGRSISLEKLNAYDKSSPDIRFTPGDNHTLVIIDDVIFSGETMFTAIRKISEHSAFKKILVAVLVDRGHRKYPVLAGIVGSDVPTKLNEQVELHLKNDHPEKVVLIDNN